MIIKRKAVLAATLSFMVPTIAHADFNFRPVGQAYDHGDWVQGFLLSSAQQFDNIGLVLSRQGGDDRTSGFSRWDLDSAAGGKKHDFVATLLTADLAAAHGGSNTEVAWDMHFAGNGDSQRFVLTLFAFDDGATAASVQSAVLNWDGSKWTARGGSGVTWEQFQAALGNGADPRPDPVVPVPAAAWLGALGLALVGAVTRRR